MARRLGSASAVKTCSATASISGWRSRRRSGGIEVAGQLAQLARPAIHMAVVDLAVGVLGQLREPGLDHREPRAGTGRLERELDVGTARVVVGKLFDLPGEAEHRRLLHSFHPHLDRVPAGPRHPGRPARAQVDVCLLAEPGGQALGRGQRSPYLPRRVSEFHGPLDAIGKSHVCLHQVATEQLPLYGNRLVASNNGTGSMCRRYCSNLPNGTSTQWWSVGEARVLGRGAVGCLGGWQPGPRGALYR